jgi:hypothetical protein
MQPGQKCVTKETATYNGSWQTSVVVGSARLSAGVLVQVLVQGSPTGQLRGTRMKIRHELYDARDDGRHH